MLFRTIALSVITLLLFLLLLSRETGRIKALLGFFTAISAAVSLVLFLLMQHASGGPDDGRELFQLYIPCGIYLLFGFWGLLAASFSLRRLKNAGGRHHQET